MIHLILCHLSSAILENCCQVFSANFVLQLSLCSCTSWQRSALQNWKVQEDQSLQSCSLLSEVLRLASPCRAIFHASIGEIFLPCPWHEGEQERMFISRQLDNRIDYLVEDMICTGCQRCGSPLCSEYDSSISFDFIC